MDQQIKPLTNIIKFEEKYSFKIIRHKSNLSQSIAIYSGIKT